MSRTTSSELRRSQTEPLVGRTQSAPIAPTAPAVSRTQTGSIEPVVSRTISGSIDAIVSRTQTGSIEPVVSRTVTPMPAIGRTITGTELDNRTPGSELVLPANPLMNLSDESLEGFVDCTIYEETGNFFGLEDGTEGMQDLPIPATSRTRTASMAAIAEPIELPTVSRTATGSIIAMPDPGSPPEMPAFGPARQTSSLQPFTAPPAPRTATSEMPALARTISGEIKALPGPPPGRTPTGELPYPYAVGDAPAYIVSQPPTVATDLPVSYPRVSAPYPQVFPGAAPDPAPPAWPTPKPALALPRNLRQRRLYLIAAIAALATVLLVMIIVVATRGSSDDDAPVVKQELPTTPEATGAATPTTPTDATTPSTPKTAVTKPSTAKPAPSEQDAGDDSAPPPNGPPVVGTGPCRLTVTTTPAGSIVQLDGNVVGPSPLTIASACQRSRIDIAHPRYQSQMRWVALAADHPGTLDVTLPRPTHAVNVLSLPPGAEVLIDGRRAGTTPTVVQVMGFTSVDMTLEKSGYQTVTKRVYSRAPQDRVFVRFIKK